MRNKLALERTQLANERTLLAYIRTGLSLMAAAVILLEFFSKSGSYTLIAWALAGTGIFVLLVGIFRFRKVRIELKKSSLTDIDNQSVS